MLIRPTLISINVKSIAKTIEFESHINKKIIVIQRRIKNDAWLAQYREKQKY